MKRFFVYTAACLVALCMAGCADKDNKESKEVSATKRAAKVERTQKGGKAPAPKGKKKGLLMPNASGLPYEMLVVMDDAQWERPVGRALFNVLDTDVPGLPQSERSFRITRVEPSGMNSNMFRIMRNIIKVDIQNIYTQYEALGPNGVMERKHFHFLELSEEADDNDDEGGTEE